MMRKGITDRIRLLGIISALILAGSLSAAAAGIEKRGRVFYLPGRYNYAFSRVHPSAYRTVAADHYAHSVVFEILWRHGEETPSLEGRVYDQAITIWYHPPRLGLTMELLTPEFSKLSWKATHVFDWVDMLHEQLYDILADDRVKDKKKAYEEAIAYYLSEKEIALSTEPIPMEVMDEQVYSGTFRMRHPKFNALLFAYHWLEPTLFEGLFLFEDPARREKILGMFITENADWFANPPQRMPLMRDTAIQWSRWAPKAANIFDNAHTLHGMIADILASPKVTDKRAEIDRAIRLMQTLPGSDANEKVTMFIPMKRDGSYWEMTKMMQEMEKHGMDPMADMHRMMQEEIRKGEEHAEQLRKMLGTD